MDSIEKFIKEHSIQNAQDMEKIYSQIVDEINRHNFLYYVKSSPEISDFEYDKLFTYLKKTEEQYPELVSLESPTQRLNNQIQDELQKAEHKFPLLSLENTYSADEVEKFIDRLNKNHQISDFFVEPKYDGLSVEIIYKAGRFKQAITRWNGQIGEDVTENVKTIQSLPLSINFKQDLHIRWEVVIRKSIFEKVNENQLKNNLQIYSNPRNLASWSLRQLDLSITKERNLDIIVYDILNYKDLQITKHTEVLSFLEENNFFVFDLKNICPNIFAERKWLNKSEILEIVNSSNVKTALDGQDIDFDWLVIKVNNTQKYEEISCTTHHPKRAFSFKYPPKQFISNLLNVEFSVWRTWTITPVAILTPIDISWVTVKRASLHNFDFIKEKNIKIWNSVLVQRSGEVIPYIVSVVDSKENKNLKIITEPHKCPVCAGETFRPKWEVALKCMNVSCPAQTKEKISYFVSKNCLDIEWLGEKTIDVFYEIWILKDYWDIFYIPNYRQKLLSLPLFQEKKIDNLIKSIQEKQNLNLDVFLTALWIEFVGKKTAKIIIEALIENNILSENEQVDFIKLQEFFQKSDFQEFLENVHGLGPQTAQSFYKFFQESHNQQVLKKLLPKLTLHIKKTNKSWKFAWKIFCITWNVAQVERWKIINFIEKNSWEFSNQITKNIDLLLIGEKPWNSKLLKATELWISTRSLQDFLQENDFKFPFKVNIQEPLF